MHLDGSARSWEDDAGRTGSADASRIEAPCAQVPIERVVSITNRRLVEFAHEHSIQVHVWTVDQPETIRELLDFDVDGIMTDRPAVLRDVLIAAGKWDAGRD